MKFYQTSVVVLLTLSVAFIFAALKSAERARRADAALTGERAALEQGRRDLLATQSAAAAAKKKGAPIEDFLKTWSQELSSESNIEHVFGQLDTLAVDNLLSPSGKNFSTNLNYFFHGQHTPVQNVNITVAGDFYRTLNWLGAVENAFPLGRVEQISYAANGNSLTVAVQFVFPRKFDPE
jgi:hypothetical protein